MIFLNHKGPKIIHIIKAGFIFAVFSHSCFGMKQYTLDDLTFLDALINHCCNNQKEEFLELYETKNRYYKNLLSTRNPQKIVPSSYPDLPIFFYATRKFDPMYQWINFFKEEMEQHLSKNPFSNLQITSILTLHDLYKRLDNQKGLKYIMTFYEKSRDQKNEISLDTFERYEEYLKSHITLDIYVLENWESLLGKSKREIHQKLQEKIACENCMEFLAEIDREEQKKTLKEEKIAKKKSEKLRKKEEKKQQALDCEKISAQDVEQIEIMKTKKAVDNALNLYHTSDFNKALCAHLDLSPREEKVLETRQGLGQRPERPLFKRY